MDDQETGSEVLVFQSTVFCAKNLIHSKVEIIELL